MVAYRRTDIRSGTERAFKAWLSTDISWGLIGDSIREAVTDWLDEHTDELLERIPDEVSERINCSFTNAQRPAKVRSVPPDSGTR